MRRCGIIGEGIMYRLLFENLAVPKEPLTVDLASAIIGRRADCQVQLLERGVSDRHAIIERRPDGYHIRSVDNAVLIYVNGDPVIERRLASGDELGIGPLHLRFEVVHGVSAARRRRPIDPLEVAAVVVVVAVIAGQIALLSSLFSENRPQRVKLDAARTAATEQTATATSSTATPAPSVVSHPAPAVVEAPQAPAEPTVLNRMIRLTRVDRTESGENVSITIQAKAQVGARELDTSAVGIYVQFAALGSAGTGVEWRKPITVPIPAWENFASKVFMVRFPGTPREFVGFVVRTYYGRQLQDIAASPPALRTVAPNPLAGGGS